MRWPSLSRPRWMVALAASILGALSLACGDDRPQENRPPEQSFGPPGPDSDAGAPACAKSTQTAAPVPLDVIFEIDRSGSMRGPKWDAVSTAALAFVHQGFPAPTRVGLTYVPVVIPEDIFGGQPGTNYKVCEYRLYKDLALPLAPVEAQRAALEEALAKALVPGGIGGFGATSPLHAALRGTYFAAAQEQDAHPDHQMVVVMMGDADPTYCADYGPESTSTSALAELAAKALQYNGVRTFAIGLQVASLPALEAITKAGGGKVLVPSSYSTEDLLDQINSLTRSAIDCVFALPAPPPGQLLDPATIHLDVTVRTGETAQVPRADAASCHGEAGWYPDNASNPTKAILCPASCDALHAKSGSRVDLSVGCAGGVQ